MIKFGKIRVNGRKLTKVSSSIRKGDVITLTKNNEILVVRVLSWPLRRGSAKNLQEERDILTKLLLGEFNYNGSITMKSLMNVLDSSRSSNLEMIYYKLKSAAMRVTELGRENDYLLSASVEHIKNLVSLFIDRKESTYINYNNDGMINESKLEHKVLDIQV